MTDFLRWELNQNRTKLTEWQMRLAQCPTSVAAQGMVKELQEQIQRAESLLGLTTSFQMVEA